MRGYTKKNGFIIKMKKRGAWIGIFCLVAALMCSGVNSADVFAGGAMGFDNDFGGGGGQPGGSSSCGRGSDDQVDCMGVSWVYYSGRLVGWEQKIMFPAALGGRPEIPGECSRKGRGFWAFGVGGLAKKHGSDGIVSFRSDNSVFVLGNSTKVNTFSTAVGGKGLQGVYPWGYMGDWSDPYKDRKYTTFSDDSLRHYLFNNGNLIYSATRYGHIGKSNSDFIKPDSAVGTSTVFQEFKMAYLYTYGEEYPGNNFPRGLTFFCYWPDMAISEFEGYAKVWSGSVPGPTNWTKENTSTGIEIECKNDGCDASFDLGLRRTLGDRGTSYTVYGNGWPVPNGNNPSFDPRGGSSVYSPTATLKPGQTVCYGISFISRSTSSEALAGAYVEACATAKVTNFQGKSSVTGATIKSTEWQNSNKTETAFIENCSPTTGCQVSFEHYLKRTEEEALGSTDYLVMRTSNLTTGDRKIDNNSNVKSGTFDANGARVSSTGPFTLYPGMVVCETLTFKPNNNQVSKPDDVTTKICASALGNAQPNDPTDPNDPNNPENDPNGDDGSNSFIDIEVKNNSVTKYNTFRRVVYGKPGDSLTYRGSYNPNVQYTYYIKPEQAKFGSVISNNGLNNPCMLGKTSICEMDGRTLATRMRSMFNEYVDPDWNNDLLIRKVNFGGQTSSSYDYVNGRVDKHMESNDYVVLKGEVGKSLDENAEINYSGNSVIKTTPSQVAFSANGDKNMGTVSTDWVYKTAHARIPYNYTTDIGILEPDPVEPANPEPDPGDSSSSSDPEDPDEPSTPAEKVPAPEIVYAGDNKPIDVKVDIKPKPNSVTNNPGDPDYATRTGNSTVKIIVYLDDGSNGKGGIDNYSASRTADLCSYYGKVSSVVSENWRCSDFVTRTGSFNESGNMNGNSTTFPTSFNVPDLDAGQRICVAAAIFPSNSGLETNWDSVDGNNAWRISDSRCFVVAKRPNLQVLGGGMFSSDKLFTSVAIKRNIYGFYPVILNGSDKSNTTVFGSWVEHQILSVGNTAGIASGASTGYFGSSSTEVPASGRTPKNGGLDAKGMFGLGGSYEGAGLDYCIRVPLTIANTNSAIPCKGRSIAGGYVTSNDLVGPSDKDKLIARFTQNTESSGIDYIKADGDYILGSTITPKGAIKVIHATGSITIDGDLVYEDNFTSLAQIPKLIIYAEKNILIGCGVRRIDAVLIAGRTNEADGIVNTCRTNFVPYTGDITSAINWKHGSTILVNAPENSNPLKITGTVIANKMVANRTYGAAKGINSVVPAETIDYDATLYGWGMRESEASASGKLQTVYLHEVAPRY